MIRGNEKKLISPYIDGELSPGQEVELEELIKASPEHSERLSEMKKLKGQISSACALPLSDDKFAGFAEKIAERVAKEPRSSRRERKITKERHFRFSKISMGTVAAILLIVLISFGMGYKKGVVVGNGVQIHGMEVDESVDVDFYSPEGATYTVLKITPREVGSVDVNYIETAEGLSYEVEPAGDSNSVIIRLSGDTEEDVPEEK